MIVIWLFAIAWAVLAIIGLWKTFHKAGLPGWAAIIPFYNEYNIVKMSNRPVWFFWAMLGCSLFAWIPVLGFFLIIGLIVLWVFIALDIAANFGQSTGFAILLIIFPSIMFLILGFGSARYNRVAAPGSAGFGSPPMPAGAGYTAAPPQPPAAGTYAAPPAPPAPPAAPVTPAGHCRRAGDASGPGDASRDASGHADRGSGGWTAAPRLRGRSRGGRRNSPRGPGSARRAADTAGELAAASAAAQLRRPTEGRPWKDRGCVAAPALRLPRDRHPGHEPGHPLDQWPVATTVLAG